MKLAIDSFGLLDIVENDHRGWAITTMAFGLGNAIDGGAMLMRDDDKIQIVVMPIYISDRMINISIMAWEGEKVTSVNILEPTGQHLGKYENIINDAIAKLN